MLVSISYTNQGGSYRKNGLPWSFHILCGYLQTDKSQVLKIKKKNANSQSKWKGTKNL